MEESFYVYGLRVKGDCEVRYIGETSQALPRRLTQHTSFMRSRRLKYGFKTKPPVEGSFAHWLATNKEQIEIFKIAKCGDKKHAERMERAIIGLCLRLEQRLFNRKHAGPYGSYKAKGSAA